MKTDFLPVAHLPESDYEDKAELVELAQEAREYLDSREWCLAVDELYFVDGFEHLAIFYADVQKAEEGKSNVWMIVGDAPPLHIETNGGVVTTAVEALVLYARRLDAWVVAARAGKRTHDAPVLLVRGSLRSLEMTKAHVDLVKRRIGLIFDTMIPWFLNDVDPTVLDE